MTFKPGFLPIPRPPALANVTSAAFDATGSYLVGGNRVFTSNDDFFDLAEEKAETDVLQTVAHPSKPIVAQRLREGANVALVELATKARTPVCELAGDVAFSRSGARLGAVFYGKPVVRLFDLEGKESGALEYPASLLSDKTPTLCFSQDDSAVIVFPSHHARVVIPLGGGAPAITNFPPAKVPTFVECQALPVGADVFLFDRRAWRYVREDGTVAWSGKGDHDAVAIVPGAKAIAVLKQTKRTISFLDPASGEELAALKIKPVLSPLGFTISSSLIAYATEKGLEVIELPALGAPGSKPATEKKAKKADK